MVTKCLYDPHSGDGNATRLQNHLIVSILHMCMLSVYMLIYCRESKSVISILYKYLTGNCIIQCIYIYQKYHCKLQYQQQYKQLASIGDNCIHTNMLQSTWRSKIHHYFPNGSSISKFDQGTAQRSTSRAGDLTIRRNRCYPSIQ